MLLTMVNLTSYKVTTISGLSSKKKQPIPFYDYVHSPHELDYLSTITSPI